MVPLYILGLLLRFGPQHGYRIKKLVENELADFTLIKLPNIYYHLERMESSCFITSKTDTDGCRPEKKIYEITDAGIKEFRSLLEKETALSYRPLFPSDALFYFSDYCDKETLKCALVKYLKQLNQTIIHIEEHQKAQLSHIPKEAQQSAEMIFEHHLLHYRAEIAWAQNALKRL